MSLPPSEKVSRANLPFHGQVVVFTGKLASFGRREARGLIHRLGGELADEVTPRTTMLIVGAASADPNDSTRTEGVQTVELLKAAEVNAQTPGKVRVLPEEDFCRLGGLPSVERPDRHHSVRQIRELYPRVREDHLRYLEKWNLVRAPVRTKSGRYYGFQDLLIIKQVSERLARGGSFRAVLRALAAARDGQLTLDFSQRMSETNPVKVVALAPRSDCENVEPETQSWKTSSAKLSLAAKYFHEAASCDEGTEEDQNRARDAYRKALLLDPNLVPALVNLANIYYARDELVEAQALYERAMHLDTECFEVYFNLGNIHHDLGRYLDALEHYRIAVGINRDYPDAHFYLAVTLEKIGHSAEAKAHWLAYRDLAPEGEWVELAKEFSE
jgi:tetratricopeptide (TPR) repeat protein